MFGNHLPAGFPGLKIWYPRHRHGCVLGGRGGGMIPAVVDWILLIYAAQGSDVGDDDLVIQEVIRGQAGQLARHVTRYRLSHILENLISNIEKVIH